MFRLKPIVELFRNVELNIVLATGCIFLVRRTA